MSNDPNQPVVLTTAPDELEAAVLVAALETGGIKAQAVGGLTSKLRAEVPGDVQILVRRGDLPAAQELLRSLAEDRPD